MGQNGFRMSQMIPLPHFLLGVTHMTASILLIDDNVVQAVTRQTILKRAGYFVITAMNPVRALERLQNADTATEIGMVITDHFMPGMSGAEFVRVLRRTHPTLPVLVISGLDEAQTEYEGLNVTFRLKPLLPDNLLSSVHHLFPSGH
jgi:CheY-like chemotaxis protein